MNRSSRPIFVIVSLLIATFLSFSVITAFTSQTNHVVDGEGVPFVKQLGGQAYAVAKKGNYLYTGVGSAFKVFDVQNPANPQVVSQVDNLSSNVYEIDITGNYAIAPGEYQLRIFDIQNPLSPTLAITYPIPSRFIHKVEISGTLLFLGESRNYNTLGGSGGLRILDISDPLNIQPVGLYGDAFDIRAFSVYGDLVYVEVCKPFDSTGCTPGNGKVDISDPTMPTEVAFVPGMYANDLERHGDYMYRNNQNGSVIEIYDLTGANPPTSIFPSASQLVIVDNKLFALSYFGSNYVYDLANPMNPTLLGTFGGSGLYGPNDVAAENGRAYVAFLGAGLQIFNTTTTPIALVGQHNEFTTPVAAEKVGGSLYLLNETERLQVLDVADPLNPAVVASLAHNVIARDLVTNGSQMVILGLRQIRLVDATNPLAPVAQGVYTTTNFAPTTGAIIKDDYVYLGTSSVSEDSLEVINISNPAQPVLAGSVGTFCHAAADLQFVGAYLYVAENRICSPGDSHIAIVNVSNPTLPVTVTNFTIADSYSLGTVALVGQYLYVAHHGYGLRILDVSNPLVPIDKGVYSVPGTNTAFGYQVDAYGGNLYVSASLDDGSTGQYILDVSKPTAPAVIGEYDYLGGTKVNDYIYYPASSKGLFIFGGPQEPVNSETVIYLPVIMSP